MAEWLALARGPFPKFGTPEWEYIAVHVRNFDIAHRATGTWNKAQELTGVPANPILIYQGGVYPSFLSDPRLLAFGNKPGGPWDSWLAETRNDYAKGQTVDAPETVAAAFASNPEQSRTQIILDSVLDEITDPKKLAERAQGAVEIVADVAKDAVVNTVELVGDVAEGAGKAAAGLLSPLIPVLVAVGLLLLLGLWLYFSSVQGIAT